MVFSLLYALSRANLLLQGTVTDLITYSTNYASNAADGNILSLYHAGDQTNSWLDIKTANSVTINTILVLFWEHCCASGTRNIYLEFRVGDTAPTAANSAVNTICHNSPTSLTGWY